MSPKVICFCALGISLSGCLQDPSGPSLSAPPPGVKGVYVLNEGNFGDPSGARLTLYDPVHDSTYRDVFEASNNGSHLGSLGDDMAFLDSTAYIVMSGSENIDVISLSNHTLLRSLVLPGSSPHDILIDAPGKRAYVTRLFKNSVFVLDLISFSVVDSLPVGSNPQGMALAGRMLYVCNSGYGASRTASVIDIAGDSVAKTVVLADGPTGCTSSSDGRIWIACTGNAFGSPATAGKVFIVNPANAAIEDSISFSGNIWGSIVMGGDGYVYLLGVTPGSFTGGPVHRIQASTRAVSLNYIAGTYYALAIDEATGDIYAADAKNFATDGEVRIYSKDGTFKKSFAAQKGPGVIRFRR